MQDFKKMQIPAENSPDHGERNSSEGNISMENTRAFLQKFKQLVAKHFKCPICQSILRDPVILECNHLFCQECLQGWTHVLQTKNEIKSCPVCRKLIRNSVDAMDIPNFTISSFLTKFAAIEQALRRDGKQPCVRKQLSELLNALEISYDFDNTETLYSLMYSRYLTNGSRKKSCVNIIHQMQASHNAKLRERIKLPKNGWQKFQANAVNTCRMICPNCLTSLSEFISTHLQLFWGRERQWVWTRPKPIFYLLAFLTFSYFFIAYIFGSALLKNPELRQYVKRLLQHTIFMFLDGPTFELVSIIHEAFLIPI
jgi:hypothetical protein